MISILVVLSPDPTLSGGKGSGEYFLGCAESAILIIEEVDDYILMT